MGRCDGHAVPLLMYVVEAFETRSMNLVLNEVNYATGGRIYGVTALDVALKTNLEMVRALNRLGAMASTRPPSQNRGRPLWRSTGGRAIWRANED